ncbi:hypothetical protein EDD85DRAFT_791015 [Armillaria nabsnona]|nr:hypothetical protein EDD85DRAFT_791015 [Armillaria nabsnona]
MIALPLLYGQMAEFDRLTNQTKYKQTLKQGFTLPELVNSEFSSLFNYGYAATWAYTAYQDLDFIDLAMTSWSTARNKPHQASWMLNNLISHYHAKVLTATLAGGTYWKTDSDKPKVTSLASGFFLICHVTMAQAGLVVVRVSQHLVDESLCPMKIKMPSEVAMLQYLRRYTSISLPDVLAYNADDDSQVGRAWMIMDSVDGEEAAKIWSTLSCEQKHKLSLAIGELYSSIISL